MAAFLSIHTHTHSGIVHDAVFKLLKRACGIHTTLTAERISADDRHFFKNNNFLALLSGHDGGREAGAAGTDDNKISFFSINNAEGQCRNECDAELLHFYLLSRYEIR